MKKSELKELIKPIVKECVQESVQEILLESGLLSSVISEVMRGVGPQRLLPEEKQAVGKMVPIGESGPWEPEREEVPQLPDKIQELKENKERLLSAIGNSAYGGIDIFEGTTPAAPEGKIGDPLGDMSPHDPGVDLSFMMPKGGKFKQIK